MAMSRARSKIRRLGRRKTTTDLEKLDGTGVSVDSSSTVRLHEDAPQPFEPFTRGRNFTMRYAKALHSNDGRYCYRSLGSTQEIRLLRLSRNGANATIQATLEHWDLSEVPAFHAVTYAWEGQLPSHDIFCDRQPLAVTKTVYQFLRRTLDYADHSLLWLDSICIDQSNLSEKNIQVGMMGLIYEAAEIVDIWLGIEDDETTKLNDMLSSSPSAGGNQDDINEEKCNLISNLLRRPWFTRAWVLQEICLAQAVQVLCGKCCWSWSNVLEWHNALADLPLSGNSNRLAQTSAIKFWFMYQHIPHHETVRLLAVARNFDASDPRDKVYAVLPLQQYRRGLFTQERIVVNYEHDISEVYRRTAARCLQSGHLCLLNCAGLVHASSRADLPSWVPDWSIKSQSESIWTPVSDNAAAGGDTTAAIPRICNNMRLLHIEALEIDTVKSTDDSTYAMPWQDVGRLSYAGQHTSSTSAFKTVSGFAGFGHTKVIGPSDILIVIPGASTPFLIRQTDIQAQYILLGECYVKGLMEGEAFNLGVESRVITLV